MNFADIICLAAVAAALFFAVRNLVRRRGKTCGCGCENCSRKKVCKGIMRGGFSPLSIFLTHFQKKRI